MTEGTWSTGGIILTGKVETLEETPFPIPISVPQITQPIVWN
jgi:hypothetical protein